MASFTAQDVKDLREKTGCGMMDCKKALTEADGDVEKAIEILREKGMAAAVKKSGRIAADGLVYAYTDKEKKISVLIEVNSETDFVAKNDEFKAFVDTCAKTVVEANPADVDALLTVKAFGTEMTVQELLQEKVLTIGENLKVRRFERFEGEAVTYIHMGGTHGVVVLFDTDVADNAGFEAMGKDVAMQIAAVNPTYVRREEVSEATLEKEKEILLAQMANDPKMANKPQQVLENIVKGKIGKFYTENCLLDQAFVKDDKMTVGQFVANSAKEFGGKIEVVKFARFEKGEGIEKKVDDLAAEVAKMV